MAQTPALSIIIALDGPAGSGKSTTARLVAERLGYLYIDTGAMYRAITLAALREQADISDEGLQSILSAYSVRLAVEPAPLFTSKNTDSEGVKTEATGTPETAITVQRTYLLHRTANGQEQTEDVSDEIRSQGVTLRVSAVSALGSVRAAMVEQQRRLGERGGVVMDGRDIGTVVFPHAELKVFLIASVEERARRRLKELQVKATVGAVLPTFEELCKQLQERDKQDSERSIAPLRKAADAQEIDTSNVSIEAQTQVIIRLARQKIEEKNLLLQQKSPQAMSIRAGSS